MTMSTARGDMIEFLNTVYPGWAPKLWEMSYNQVNAIYCRILRKQRDAAILRARELEAQRFLSEDAKKPKPTSYLCRTCMRIYLVDNPELQECLFCGSTNLGRNYND